jgi:hypothetical protein
MLIILLVIICYMIESIEKVFYDRVAIWKNSIGQTNTGLKNAKPTKGFKNCFLIPFRRMQLWAAIT